jgi:hypothetical protein
MATQYLVVSNPPHDSVDPRATARCFGLSPAEAKMKSNFRAPEIWLADADRSALERNMDELRAAGARVQLLDGAVLVEVPAQVAASSFCFTDAGFIATADDGQVEIPYDARVCAVFCRPPAGVSMEPRKTMSMADTIGRGSTSVMLSRGVGTAASLAETLERSTFVDLYATFGDEVQRISVAQDIVDFSGLGPRKQPNAAANMTAFIEECEERFPQISVDRRLVDVLPRRRIMVGAAHTHEHEDRRLYSFGTRALSSLLESISPRLKDLTQYELGSRLSYVMSRE